MIAYDEDGEEIKDQVFHKIYAVIKHGTGKEQRALCAAFEKRDNVSRWLGQYDAQDVHIHGCKGFKKATGPITDEDYVSLVKFCDGRLKGTDGMKITEVLRMIKSDTLRKERHITL